MNHNKICDSEERRLKWLMNYKLPHSWKKVGWVLFIISLVSILLIKFLDGDFELLKAILKNSMLLGLLIVTLSKETIEDEFIENLRSKAFRGSFLVGVIYVLVQPLVNYVAFLIARPDKAEVEDLGDFQILWFLLVVYLTIFWMLKRKAK